MRFRLSSLFLIVFFGALISFYLANYVLIPEIPKSRFSSVDGFSIVEDFVDIDSKSGDRLYFRYGRHYDSGVEVERRKGERTIWLVFSENQQVEHSKYAHDVSLTVKGDVFDIRSIGSCGTVHEQRNLKDGKLLSRSLK